jgi:thiol:disulfide interchange protein DsbD
MKRLMIILLVLISIQKISAQTSSSITTWKYTVAEVDGKKQLQFHATIKEGWHLYSQFLVGDGPVPTTFNFNESKNYSLIGKVKEVKAKTMYDPNFDMQISYFEGKTIFTQEIKNNTKEKQKVSGTIDFMVCNDIMCYPPEAIEFSIDLP